MTGNPVIDAIWIAGGDDEYIFKVRNALVSRFPELELKSFKTLAALRESLAQESPAVLLLHWEMPDGRASNLLNDPIWANDAPIVVMGDCNVDELKAERTTVEAAAYVDMLDIDAERFPEVIEEVRQRWQEFDTGERTIETLRQSEQRYRSLIEESVQGIMIHQRYKPVLVNRAYSRILGYDSPDEVLALPDIRSTYALHEHDRLAAWQHARMEGRQAPSQYEFDAIRKDGKVIRLQNIVRRVDWYGRPATQHSVIDITQQVADKEALRYSEQRFKDYASASSDFYWEMNETLRFSWFSDKFTEVTGVSTDALLGKTRQETPIPGIDKRDWWKHLADLRERRPFRDFIHPRQHEDGRTVWLSISGVPVFDDQGSFRGYRGAGTDVTRLVEATRALEEGEKRFRALYDNNPCMFFTLDADGCVLSTNRYAAQQLGFSKREIIGKSFTTMYPEIEHRMLRAALERCIRRDDGVERWEASRLRKDGTTFWAIETARCVRNPDGEAEVLVVCEDVTEIHDLSRKLAHQAAHDTLTGLVNRNEFERRLTNIADSRDGRDDEHAVLFLDVDQFKKINDTCGHEAGDKLLHELTRLIETQIRKHDTLARVGGDEFGVILEQCPVSRATAIAEQIRRTIEDYQFAWNGNRMKLSVSLGVVGMSPGHMTAGEVLSAADSACYLAKQNGRNRLQIYDPDDDDIQDLRGAMQWATRIENAFEEDRFTLYYQPIVSNTRDPGQRIHIELLLRMIDDDGTTISPASFLPAAERYNLSSRIDRWVVRSALNWLDQDDRLLERIETCSINLSGSSIGDETFFDFVSDELSNVNVPGEKICFEVTETIAISNIFKAIHFMRELKRLGIRFALDDFGSGFSTFAYLKTLPVDFLKIDGSFVKEMADDEINLAMVKSINDIGHVMGKQTVAEYVCDDRVRELLADMSVDFVQGYALGRPRPIDALQNSGSRMHVA